MERNPKTLGFVAPVGAERSDEKESFHMFNWSVKG